MSTDVLNFETWGMAEMEKPDLKKFIQTYRKSEVVFSEGMARGVEVNWVSRDFEDSPYA